MNLSAMCSCLNWSGYCAVEGSVANGKVLAVIYSVGMPDAKAELRCHIFVFGTKKSEVVQTLRSLLADSEEVLETIFYMVSDGQITDRSYAAYTEKLMKVVFKAEKGECNSPCVGLTAESVIRLHSPVV